MGKKKLTTAEILAAARAQSGGGSQASDEKSDVAETGDVVEASEPVAEEKPKSAPKPKASGAPKSTADILAAARSQSKGGATEKKKPAAGGAPKSTADILAAARGASGKSSSGGGAKKEKTAASAKSAPTGDRPSVQEMLRAAKSGKPIEAGSGKPSFVVPKKPVLTAKGKGKKGKDVPRRNMLMALLLSPFAIAWMAMGSAAGIFTLGIARFMMPNAMVEPPSKFKVGPVGDYPADAVITKWKAQFGIWLVNVDWKGKREIYALASVCTHLGCTPNWLEGEQKFKCPCHGSGFYKNGVNFEGPAPRPLERMGIRVAEDGMIEVDKGQKFQEEMGQWEDAASYIEIV